MCFKVSCDTTFLLEMTPAASPREHWASELCWVCVKNKERVSGVDNGGLVWKQLREISKVGGQEFGRQRWKARTHTHTGGLTTSTHSAWRADNTFRGWTPSGSKHTDALNPHTHTHTQSDGLLVVGRRTSLQPGAPDVGNFGPCDASYSFPWLAMLSYTSMQNELTCA